MDVKNNQPAAVRKANETAKGFKIRSYTKRINGCISLLWTRKSLKNFKQEILALGLQRVDSSKLELKGKSAAQGKIQGQLLSNF